MVDKKLVMSALKEAKAVALGEIKALDAAMAALGGNGAGAAPAAKPKRKRNMQAAHDAMAVRRGTATPEQLARHEKRQLEKVGATTESAAE